MRALTCFIFTPHMDPLTSMTNTMFLGRGDRLEGAKKWTKWPSDTWKKKQQSETCFCARATLKATNGASDGKEGGREQVGRNERHLQLSSVAVSRHVVYDRQDAVDAAVGAVLTLPLLPQVRLEDDVSLRNKR